MANRTEWHDNEMWFEHGGVRVYHTYRNDYDEEGVESDTYGVTPDASSTVSMSGPLGHFCFPSFRAGDLPRAPGEAAIPRGHARIGREANGHLATWKMQRIKQAIDRGWITRESFDVDAILLALQRDQAAEKNPQAYDPGPYMPVDWALVKEKDSCTLPSEEITPEEALLAITRTRFRPFDQSDWDGFAGCESDHPLIGESGGCIWIIDGSKLCRIMPSTGAEAHYEMARGDV